MCKNPSMKCDSGEKARLQRIAEEFNEGSEFLKSFCDERVVTIFGSHRLTQNTRIYQEARKLGGILAEKGMITATGGGPGVMEAANRGAFENGGRSVGLGIELYGKEPQNKYVRESLIFYYFFVRKVMLARIGQAYVFFPGAFGTLDEFFEFSTLVVTKKFHKEMPIILVGKDYWTSLLDWLQKIPMEEYGVLLKEELSIWKIVDKAEDVFPLISKIPKEFKHHESI